MLCRKAVVFTTLMCFIVCTQGCYTSKSITVQELEEKPEQTIQKVVTLDNKVYEFPDGGQFIENMIVGYTAEGEFIKLPIEQVSVIYIREVGPTEEGRYCLGAVAVAGIVGIIVGIIAFNRAMDAVGESSCPFIYAFDGEEYVLDGEPYGGAVCQGLQRTDYCRLDNINQVEGEYRIMLTNELYEIQYTDELKLVIADHAKNVQVYQDANGHFYTTGEMQKPLLVTDTDGNDYYQFLSAEDNMLWESYIDMRHINPSEDLRDTLIMSFPRHSYSKKAKFIVSGCNTIWGSHMLRQMVHLFGNQVTEWYDEMLTPQWQGLIEEWNDHVELYQLQIYVWEANGWKHQGEIMGGGPIVSETRVIPLDLTNVNGDSVTIRIMPPKGFWQFNMFAIDYSEDVPIHIHEVSAIQAVAHDGADICDKLEVSDSDYYVMPETGQQAFLVFPAPALHPDKERTVFARVSGYYDLKIETDEPPQIAQIYQILTDPDYAVTFSNGEFLKFINQYTSLLE